MGGRGRPPRRRFPRAPAPPRRRAARAPRGPAPGRVSSAVASAGRCTAGKQAVQGAGLHTPVGTGTADRYLNPRRPCDEPGERGLDAQATSRVSRRFHRLRGQRPRPAKAGLRGSAPRPQAHSPEGRPARPPEHRRRSPQQTPRLPLASGSVGPVRS